MSTYIGKSRQELEKLNKKQLADALLEVGESTAILEEINDKLESIKLEFSDFKNAANARFEKLEGEVAIVKNANALLKKEVDKLNVDDSRIVELEKEAFRTAEYVNYDSLEISKIPLGIPDDELTGVMLKVLNSLRPDEVPLTPAQLHACHRRQGKYNRENVLVKMVWRGDAYFLLRHAKNLKDKVLTDIDERLSKPIFINEHLTPYYSQLRYRCKMLWKAKMIEKFWVSGHKVKVCVAKEDDYKILSHTNDIFDLFPGMDINHVFREMKTGRK